MENTFYTPLPLEPIHNMMGVKPSLEVGGMTQNFDQIQKLTQELQETRRQLQLYQELYQHLPTTHFTVDVRGMIHFASKRARLTFGCSTANLVGQSIFQWVPSLDQTILSAALQQVIDSSEMITCQHQICKGDGHKHWVKASLIASDRPDLTPQNLTLIQLVWQETHPNSETLDERITTLTAINETLRQELIHYQQGSLYQKLQAELQERQRTEAEVEALAQRLLTVIETVGEGITLSDRQGNFAIFNPTIEEITGYTRQEANRCPDFLGLLYPDTVEYQHTQTHLQTVLETGKIRNFETTIAAKDGTPRTLLVSTSLVQLKSGPYFLSVYRDITDRKSVAVALAKERANLAEAQKIAHVGSWEFDLATQTITWSDEVFRIYGLDPQQPPPTESEHRQYIHPEDQRLWETALQQLRVEGKAYQTEFRIVRPNGETRYLYGKAEPFLNEHGEIIRLFGTVLDISDRKHIENELRHSKRLIEQIADASPLLLYLYDLNTSDIVYVNRPITDLLGTAPNFQPPDSVNVLRNRLHPNDQAQLQHQIQQLTLLGDGEILESEYRLRQRDGSWRWFSCREVVFTRTLEGYPQQILAIALDITDQKEYETQLQDSQSRFQTIVNSTSDGILIVDHAGIIRFANPAAAQIFNRPLSTLVDYEFGQPFVGENATEIHLVRAYGEPGVGEMRVTQTQWSGEAVYVVSLRDITQRCKAEEARRESEERFRQLAENVQVAFWLLCPLTHKILYISPAYQHIWGRSCESLYLSTNSWIEAIHSEDQNTVFNNMKKHKQGESTTAEYRIFRPDGSQRWILTRAFPIENEWGEIYRVAGISEDITERKQAEEALRNQEEQLRLITNALPVCISYLDSQQRYRFANKTLESWFGIHTEEMLNQHLQDVIGEATYQLLKPQLNRVLEGEAVQYEAQIPDCKGELRDVMGALIPDKDENLKVRGYYSLITDVSELKQTQRALEQLRHRNELILNAAGEGICGLDWQNLITFVNPAAAKMLGYEIFDLIGQPVQKILAPQLDSRSQDSTPTLICSEVETCSPHQSEFKRQDGSSFPVEYVCTPVDQQDMNVGAVLTFKDITERKAVERMKQEFISIVSHELRTPLTSMRGALGLMATGKLGLIPPKAQEMLEIGINNTKRLGRLINDLLDLQRLELGRVQFQYQPYSLIQLLTEAVDTMGTMAQQADIALEIKPLDQPLKQAQLWVDSDRILQVLTNLLSNAIKFSPPGTTVTLDATQASVPPYSPHINSASSTSFSLPHLVSQPPTPKKPSSAKIEYHPPRSVSVYVQPSQVLINVIDQGRGIPPDQLEQIFEPFQQIDASDARQKGGTGLGLTICRQIIQQHGGHIWAENLETRGCKISLTLPLYS